VVDTSRVSNSISKTMALLPLAATLVAGPVGCGTDEPRDAGSGDASVETAEEAEASAENGIPRIDSVRFEPANPGAGDDVRVVAEVSDPDGDTVWVEYEWSVSGVPTDDDTPRILLRGAEKGDIVEVTLTARDGVDESEPWTESVIVANSPPEVGRVRVEPGNEIVAGTPVVVRPEAMDPDGDSVSYRFAWKGNGVPVSQSGPQLITDALHRGDRIQVSVVASDSDDESEPVEVPELRVVNTPPRILAGSGRPIAGDGSFHRVRAEDPDGDPELLFELDDPPAGMTIDAVTGAISWEPSQVQPGTHHVAVIVDDLNGGRTRQTIEITVSPSGGDAQPPASAQ